MRHLCRTCYTSPASTVIPLFREPSQRSQQGQTDAIQSSCHWAEVRCWFRQSAALLPTCTKHLNHSLYYILQATCQRNAVKEYRFVRSALSVGPHPRKSVHHDRLAGRCLRASLPPRIPDDLHKNQIGRGEDSMHLEKGPRGPTRRLSWLRGGIPRRSHSCLVTLAMELLCRICRRYPANIGMHHQAEMEDRPGARMAAL